MPEFAKRDIGNKKQGQYAVDPECIGYTDLSQMQFLEKRHSQ